MCSGVVTRPRGGAFGAAAQACPKAVAGDGDLDTPRHLTDRPETGAVARQLWRTCGLGPGDIDVGILYDHFTPFVPMQLEEFGFCGRGEAADFVAERRLPLNTHDGQLGEAYPHGMNGIAEAVRRLRGTAVNRIPGAARALVTAGTGVPASGLVLTADG